LYSLITLPSSLPPPPSSSSGYDNFLTSTQELKASVNKVEEKKFLKWLSDIQDKIDENNKNFFLNDQVVVLFLLSY